MFYLNRSLYKNLIQGTYTLILILVAYSLLSGCSKSGNTNKSPDFIPNIEIGNVFFPAAMSARDFIVSISEVSNLSPNVGAIQFNLIKASAFTITYGSVNGQADVFGLQTTNNGDWTITENALIITATLKPTAQIHSNSFSKIGFRIARKAGIAANTSQALGVFIVNSSGGDSNDSNNSSGITITAQ